MIKARMLLRIRRGGRAKCRQRFTTVVLCALLLSAARSPLALEAAGPAKATAVSPKAVVRMSDKPLVFTPAVVQIKVGDAVEWSNTALTIHSITADPSKAARPGDMKLPPGAKPFDSGFLVPGQTFRYTFEVPGTYKYFCIPHEGDRMFGEVVVR